VPNADDISRTIEPGSLDQGDRQVVAQQLQTAIGPQTGPQPGSAPAPAGAPGADELSRLLDGGHSSDLPVTDGLSLGPGKGPASAAGLRSDSPKVKKLRLLALGASSPVLRQMARDALRAALAREA